MLYDQYGHPINSAHPLYKASAKRPGISRQRNYLHDSDRLVSPYNWQSLVSASRELYANNGIVISAIDDKATYSIGRAFVARSGSANKSWATKANDYIAEWYKVCNVQGGLMDFLSSLYLISTSMDIDGDNLVLLTRDQNNLPRIQIIPAHRIYSAEWGIIKTGYYSGKFIQNGVITNKVGRAIAYKLDDRTYIPAAAVIQAIDPKFIKQSRGIPIFSHAINDFKSIDDVTEAELHAAKIAAEIALVEHNEEGAADDYEGLYNSNKSPNGEPEMKSLGNGRIKYFKAGGSGKLEIPRFERPSPNYQNFEERLTIKALAGVGVPYSIAARASTNGTANRVDLTKMDKTCTDRNATLTAVATRVITYVVASAIQHGHLPGNNEWHKWTFSKPGRPSIDLGRDTKSRISEYKAGIKNLSDFVEEDGKFLEGHLEARAAELALAELSRQEAEKKYGVTIDPAAMRSL